VNIQKKLPGKLGDFQELSVTAALTVTAAPPVVLVQTTEKIINQKDAPILAAALFSQVHYICTLDQKDFHTSKVEQWCARRQLGIVTPGELLLQWRNR
jgi:predicted nucleic acid-binding protein